jgi:peptide-methionine (R)-S-oxide reductase
MSRRPDISRDALRERLSPEQFEVTQQQATEAPFTGAYLDCRTPGTYRCVCCGSDLFRSSEKYDSGTGWPSFFAPVSASAVSIREDRSHGTIRDEVSCSDCGSHLGHVFPDGPRPSGFRYCINSASLDLAPSRKIDN